MDIIKMKTYKKQLGTDLAVFRTIDNHVIDQNMTQDWQVYQEWLQAGNVPDEPEQPPVFSNLDFINFMKLFTPEEETAFVNSTNTKIKLFLMRLVSMSNINTQSAEIIDGLSYLVIDNILTEKRKQEILSLEKKQA